MTESIDDLKRIKAQCIADISQSLPYYRDILLHIDGRVWDYAQDVVRTDIDIHNLDEILCLRKFLRLLDTYEFDYDRVHQVIYDAEGIWDGNKHVKGGLKIDGIYGYTYYRQTPMQVFVYAWIYGFRVWKDTTSPIGSRTMLPSEREGNNGTIEDNRRLVTNFVMMWPRKVAKTFSGAFIQFEGLMRGERDYEGYIAANSADQSKLLFEQLTNMVTQLDGWGKYFKLTNSPQDRCIAWKRSTGRIASVRALTAGGKTKDGLKASCCSADEFGASQRISGKIADMEGLINVIEGSMGPRREPLTVHTSTAGLGLETPYEMKINALHDSLMSEMEYRLRNENDNENANNSSFHHSINSSFENDWQGAVILRPDAWERDDEEALRSERVIRKVNPNLGVTIQPDFYSKEWASADMEGDGKRKEVVTKLYNIFATDRAVDWVTADEIRALQIDAKIEDCTSSQGWIVLTGMDFTNVGNDLQASSYLAVRNIPGTTKREFRAFMDAWITTEAVMASTNKNLLLDWAEMGYLHIVDSKVLSPDMPVDRIVELRRKGVNMMGFGYDPYKANDPINKIKTWIASLGVKPSDIGSYVMPVGQKFGNMNPLVDEMTYMIRCEEPLIRFEDTPLWPWEFNNCQIVESTDGMENKKIVKTRADNKVDNCQALLNALYVYDTMNGRVVR